MSLYRRPRCCNIGGGFLLKNNHDVPALNFGFQRLFQVFLYRIPGGKLPHASVGLNERNVSFVDTNEKLRFRLLNLLERAVRP